MIGPIRTTLVFDGYRISDDFIISSISRPRPVRSSQVSELDGARGGILVSSTINPIQIDVSLVALGDWTQRIARMDKLIQALDVTTPKRLYFGDDSERYYLAIPSNGGGTSAYHWADSIDVSFVVPDPARYGRLNSVTVTSSSVVRINGNTVTYPTITVASTASSAWGLRVDGGDYARVSCGSGHALVIDCESRKVTVDGNASTIDLNADWLELSPGARTLAIMGSGSAVVTWRERWM